MSEDKQFTPEPAVVTGTVAGLVAAAIAVLVAFFPDSITELQTVAILGFVGAVVPIVAGFIIRGKVSPWPVPRRAVGVDNHTDLEGRTI